MKKDILLLLFAFTIGSFSYAQVGIGTQNPQGIFNIDGAKDNATSGAPAVAAQANDFVVTSTGSVGIGTTSPANKLQVNGNALFAPRTTNDGIPTSGSPITVEIYGKLPTGTATQVGGIKMGWFNSFGGIEVLRGASFIGMGLGFNIASEATGTTSEAMRITSDGKVGIGTTAPTQILQVFGGNVEIGGSSSQTGSVANPMLRIHSNANVNANGGFLEFNENDLNYGYTIRHNTEAGAYGNDGIWFENKIAGVYTPILGFDYLRNVGIGTTTPTQRLDVAGSVKFSGALLPGNNSGLAGQILTSAGSGVTPTWTTLTTANTPNIYSADGTLAGNRIVTQGANNLTFSSTTGNFIYNPSSSTGRMGIGTTAPAQKLDVNGTLLLRNGNAGSIFTTNQIVFGFEGNNTYRHVLKSRHSISNNDQNTLDFYMWKSTDANTADGSQHVMTLTGNGNIGVGTTTPATKLHVNSDLAATNTINANASMLRLSRPTTPTVKWDNIAQFNLGSYAVSSVSTNDANTRMDLAMNDGANTTTSNVMTWQANGNVGIGTTAPSGKLHVYFASAGEQPTWERTNSGTGSVQALAGKYVLNNLATASTSLAPNSLGLGFNFAYKSNTESEKYIGAIATKLTDYATGKGRMDFIVNGASNGTDIALTIDSNKNVGIGTTAPAVKLVVAGTSSETNVAQFFTTATGSNLAGIGIGNGSNGWAKLAGGNGLFQIRNYSNETAYLHVDIGNSLATQGNVGIGTTTPTTKLEVKGAATNTHVADVSGTTIDFSLSNVMGTTASAGAITLQNLKSGGSYTLAVKGTTSGTCTFTASGFTVHLPADNGATTAGKHSLYNFLVVGTDVYVSWVTGL